MKLDNDTGGDGEMSLGQQVAAALGAATPDDAARLTMLRRAVRRLLRHEPLEMLECLAIQQSFASDA